MATPAITWKVTITTGSNDKLDLKEDAGGEQTITLDAGTYEMFGASGTAGTIAKELKTQLDKKAGTYTVAVSSGAIVTIGVSIGASAVQFLGATGTNRVLSCRYLTGLGAVDTSSAASVTFGSQVHGVFLFADGGPDLTDDTEDRARIDSPQSVAWSGKTVERPLGSFRYERKINVGLVPRAKMFASTNNDKSIESMQAYIRGGNSRVIRWYADPSDQATYSTYHVAPAGDRLDSLDKWERHSPGTELWSGEMLLRKYVA